MDLQQLESFVRVAELGSLTRAAMVLGVVVTILVAAVLIGLLLFYRERDRDEG